MSDDLEIDLDDLIDVLPDDEIDALLNDLDLGDFDNEKTEDADLIRHGDNDRVDPAKSRDAKKRYNQNRNTYRKAFDKFRRSSRGKLFYKKLSRFNQRPSTIMNKDEQVESLIDKVIAGQNPVNVLESVALPNGVFKVKTKPYNGHPSYDIELTPKTLGSGAEWYSVKDLGTGRSGIGQVKKDAVIKNLNDGFYTIIK